MKGSTSAPSSATTNGTRSAIKPETKWTSRLSRSSLATEIGHLRRRASARAAASCGRRSRASAPDENGRLKKEGHGIFAAIMAVWERLEGRVGVRPEEEEEGQE